MNKHDVELVEGLVNALRRMVQELEITLNLKDRTLVINEDQPAPVIDFKNGPVFSGKHLTNNIYQQFKHVQSEIREINEELYPFMDATNPRHEKLNVKKTAMEFVDGQNSLQTGLKILEKDYGINISEIRQEVFYKNLARGYRPGDSEGVICDKSIGNQKKVWHLLGIPVREILNCPQKRKEVCAELGLKSEGLELEEFITKAIREMPPRMEELRPEKINPDKKFLEILDFIEKMDGRIFEKIDWEKVNEQRRKIEFGITAREVEAQREEFLKRCGRGYQKK